MNGRMLKGVGISLAVLVLWAASLILLLSSNLAVRAPLLAVPAMLWQTFLYTGLFIVAHDSMHGSIAPGHKKVNALIGNVVVVLYALFSYTNLRKKHFKHHLAPASAEDPDYHDGVHSGFLRWYMRFMRNYLTIWQIVGMALLFNLLHYVFHIDTINLLLFWVAPALLSTLQLFYFGTYLPHRQPAGGYDNKYRARSNEYSVFWSFISCYHFGYHLQHHQRPDLPWWGLPAFKKGR